MASLNTISVPPTESDRRPCTTCGAYPAWAPTPTSSNTGQESQYDSQYDQDVFMRTISDVFDFGQNGGNNVNSHNVNRNSDNENNNNSSGFAAEHCKDCGLVLQSIRRLLEQWKPTQSFKFDIKCRKGGHRIKWRTMCAEGHPLEWRTS